MKPCLILRHCKDTTRTLRISNVLPTFFQKNETFFQPRDLQANRNGRFFPSPARAEKKGKSFFPSRKIIFSNDINLPPSQFFLPRGKMRAARGTFVPKNEKREPLMQKIAPKNAKNRHKNDGKMGQKHPFLVTKTTSGTHIAPPTHFSCINQTTDNLHVGCAAVHRACHDCHCHDCH